MHTLPEPRVKATPEHGAMTIRVSESCQAPAIREGDTVVVDRDKVHGDGDYVVVMLDGRQTLRQIDGDMLITQRDYEPIPLAEVEVVGVVVAVRRAV